MEAQAAAHTASLVLRDGVIMLGAALLFVTLFRRLGLGAVLGYLIAGALVGPHGFGWVTAGESLLHIADFGIVLLLFLVGLELHPSRLWRLKHDIFGLGLLQVVASGLVLAALVYALPASPGRPRWRSVCRWLCRRPRRCCRASGRTERSTRATASEPSRSCSSRIFRSCL